MAVAPVCLPGRSRRGLGAVSPGKGSGEVSGSENSIPPRLCQLGSPLKGTGTRGSKSSLPDSGTRKPGGDAPGSAAHVVQSTPRTPRSWRGILSPPAIPADRTQSPKRPACPAPGSCAAHNSLWPQRNGEVMSHSGTGSQRGHCCPKSPGGHIQPCSSSRPVGPCPPDCFCEKQGERGHTGPRVI